MPQGRGRKADIGVGRAFFILPAPASFCVLAVGANVIIMPVTARLRDRTAFARISSSCASGFSSGCRNVAMNRSHARGSKLKPTSPLLFGWCQRKSDLRRNANRCAIVAVYVKSQFNTSSVENAVGAVYGGHGRPFVNDLLNAFAFVYRADDFPPVRAAFLKRRRGQQAPPATAAQLTPPASQHGREHQ